MLHHLAILKGITNKTERTQMVEDSLQQTNLWNARKKSLSTYAGSMKQRFGIAQALLANPSLLSWTSRPPARPCRAESLSQSSKLDRIERDGHSLNPHRRRRARALPPHVHHFERRTAPGRRSLGGPRCGRHYFSYDMADVKTLDFYALISAGYDVKREMYQGAVDPVAIEVALCHAN
jgi:hypothetical protein